MTKCSCLWWKARQEGWRADVHKGSDGKAGPGTACYSSPVMWETLPPRTVLIRRKETKAYKVHRSCDPDRTNLTALEMNKGSWVDVMVLDIEHLTKQVKSGCQIFWEFTECFQSYAWTVYIFTQIWKALRSWKSQNKPAVLLFKPILERVHQNI